ncbi:MAG: PKD domain-containing protein [Thermoplasmatota archaeon]
MSSKKVSWEIIGIIFVILLLLYPIFSATEATSSSMNLQDNGTPAVPDDFYGSITINEHPASAGTELQMRIDGEVVNDPEIFVTEDRGYYGDPEASPPRYLTAQAYQEDKGKSIEFFIKHQGEWLKASQTDPEDIEFKGGEVREVDLHFETEPIPPTIESLSSKSVNSNQATLEMTFDIKYHDSVETRFEWRRKNEGLEWQQTNWSEQNESSKITETITNLESDQSYEYRAEIRYNSESVKSEIESFTTSAEGNVAPNPEFEWEPSRPNEGQSVEFDASGSSDPDGEIDYYLWDFDDGNEDQGEKTEHVYKEPGNYTVSLDVIDDEGASVSLSQTIEIYEISFRINGLKLNEDEINVGEVLEGYLNIENTGLNTAKYEEKVYLEKDGNVIKSDTLSIELSPGHERALGFNFTVEEKGEYTVRVGEKEEQIKVLEKKGNGEEGMDLIWFIIPLILIAIISVFLVINKNNIIGNKKEKDEGEVEEDAKGKIEDEEQ